MKPKYLLFFILFTNFILAQNPVSRMFYLDSLWNETEEGKHTYYRIIKDYYKNQPLHQVSDYYKNDTLQMKGYTSSVEKLIKEGSFIYYYQNGLKESIANYKENRLVGKEFKWYDNGNKQSDGEYILASDPFEPSIFVLNQYWSKNGQQKVIDGEGDYEESDDLFFLSGKISKGQNTGEWKGENKKEKIKFVEIYHDGNLVSGVSIDSSSVKYNYYKVMIQPRPKKGLGHFYKYIGSKFRIPKGFEKINGEIFLTFIIGKDGDARDVKIIKSLGEDIDNEAIRIIKSYPDWSPGVYRGIKINTLYSIPIKVVAGE